MKHLVQWQHEKLPDIIKSGTEVYSTVMECNSFIESVYCDNSGEPIFRFNDGHLARFCELKGKWI
jgi:hypothetical protein